MKVARPPDASQICASAMPPRQDSTAPVSRPRPPARRSRRWPAIGLLLFIACGVTAGFTWWQQQRERARVQASLPARPDLAGRAPVFTEMLTAADARARSSTMVLDQVAELGRLYHANGFPREAAACWRILHAAQPDEPRWPYYLAELSRIASNQEEAGRLLQETLRLAPDYAPARLHLANLQFKSGASQEAAQHYRRRLVALPQDPHARLGLARLALQAGRTDEARRELNMLLRDAPHFGTGHNLYAEILAAAGDEAGAAKHRWLGQETLRYRDPADPWLDELQAWCHDPERLCLLGTLELHTENQAKAQALFERAIRLEPDGTTAYELLADLHLKRHAPHQTRVLVEQALSRPTGNKTPLLFNLLSQAHRQLGQPDEAVRVARAGIAQTGEEPELLDALGLALVASGQADEAISTWQAALARHPNHAGMNYNLSTALLARRQLDDALAALDRALALQPTLLPALLLRGEIELEAAHPDLAEKYLRPAFASHPEDPRARRLLAEWHRHKGAAAEAARDPASAERHYRDGLTLDADHAELQVSLGLFYLVQGRPAEAIDPLLAYRRSHPESPQASVFLGQAYAAAGRRNEARAALTRGVELGEQAGNARVVEHCRTMLQQL
ncbi:MAG TPA: tetratricopeptide repeat protein [Lacunisphaera sp.]|nr:tetratricopeptide repeat protein [Lacunisphaera sp.]